MPQNSHENEPQRNASSAAGFNFVEFGDNAGAALAVNHRYGNSNIGVLDTGDGLTIVDSGGSPSQAQMAWGVISANISEETITQPKLKRVLLSSSRIANSGGSLAFWQAAFYGSKTTSDDLELPPNIEVFTKLLPHLANEYVEENFHTRNISHVITEPTDLTNEVYLQLSEGESPGCLAVVVATDSLAYLGSTASFGVTPLAFNANFESWIESLNKIKNTGVKTFVPGHGPFGGVPELDEFINYLEACIEAKGCTLKTGPWDNWTNSEFHEINVERAHNVSLGNQEIPKAMLKMLGLETN